MPNLSKAPNGLPRDTYVDLVDTLFGTVGSFVAGVVGGSIAPVVAYIRTGQTVFVWLGVAMIAAACFRLAVMMGYRLSAPDERKAKAEHWESLYAFGAIAYMVVVGVTGAALFRVHADLLSIVYGVVVVMGCVGAVAGRNAARPAIVVGQVTALVTPMCMVFWLDFDGWRAGLSLLLALTFISVASTTKFLNDHLLNALLNGREAKIQKERFDTALNNMSQGLCMADDKGVLSVVNSHFPAMFGVQGDLAGRTVRELAERIASAKALPDDEAQAFAAGFERRVGKSRASVFTATLGDRIYDFRCNPMEGGGMVVVAEDVTETRLASRKIEHMAMFDALTGLPNRAQFRDKMQSACEQSADHGREFSVLCVDLDMFKDVNDTLGHPMGDKLLRDVARRLVAAVRVGDLVARFGGDEFVILLAPSRERIDLDAVCERLIAAVAAPYDIDGHTIVIGASVGAATAPQNGDDADTLIRNADMALYFAKANARGGFRRFATSMDEQAQHKRQIETDLRKAIANGELEVFYQPIVDARTNRANCFEALVRWRHPLKGLVSPGVFIPIAEETGLIIEIGEWVLQRACRDAATWPDSIRVAVNFSAVQFRRTRIVDVVTRALGASGLKANRLEVEVTETIVIQDTEATLAVFRELSDLGVRLALDDFGSGYSSLSYLNRFPFHKIKIDQAFVKDLHDPKSLAIINAVMHLAQDMNLSLVVEGVETAEQLAILTKRGVHEIQGYYFSQPKPLAEIIEMTRTPILPRLRAVA